MAQNSTVVSAFPVLARGPGRTVMLLQKLTKNSPQLWL